MLNIAHPPGSDKPSTTPSMRHQAIAAAIALLAETFPRCFSVYQERRRPLKIGIDKDVLTALDGAITPAELHRALGFYCSNPFYLGYMRKGTWRLDLNGEPAGAVTDDEEAHAREMLARCHKAAAAKAAAQPKRLSLADLKAAGKARAINPQEANKGR